MQIHWSGHIGADGRPRLPLKIKGLLQQVDFEAVVDTGFTGFLYMPLLAAIPVGVLLHTTGRVTLADGSEVTVLLAQLEVEVQGDKLPALTMLDIGGGNDVLVGMEFMRNFRRTLQVDGFGSCSLLDRDWLEQTSKKALDSLKDEQPSSSPTAP